MSEAASVLEIDYIALLVMIGYLGITTLAGSLLARRTLSSNDWFVAGGGMGVLFIAVGIAGTRIGGVGCPF